MQGGLASSNKPTDIQQLQQHLQAVQATLHSLQVEPAPRDLDMGEGSLTAGDCNSQVVVYHEQVISSHSPSHRTTSGAGAMAAEQHAATLSQPALAEAQERVLSSSHNNLIAAQPLQLDNTPSEHTEVPGSPSSASDSDQSAQIQPVSMHQLGMLQSRISDLANHLSSLQQTVELLAGAIPEQQEQIVAVMDSVQLLASDHAAHRQRSQQEQRDSYVMSSRPGSPQTLAEALQQHQHQHQQDVDDLNQGITLSNLAGAGRHHADPSAPLALAQAAAHAQLALSEQMRSLEASVLALQQDFCSLADRSAQQHGLSAGAGASESVAQAAVEVLVNRVDALEVQLGGLADAFKPLAALCDELASVKAAANNTTAVAADVDALRSDMASLQAVVPAWAVMRSDLAGVQHDISNIMSDMATLQTGTTNARSDLAADVSVALAEASQTAIANQGSLQELHTRLDNQAEASKCHWNAADTRMGSIEVQVLDLQQLLDRLLHSAPATMQSSSQPELCVLQPNSSDHTQQQAVAMNSALLQQRLEGVELKVAQLQLQQHNAASAQPSGAEQQGLVQAAPQGVGPNGLIESDMKQQLEQLQAQVQQLQQQVTVSASGGNAGSLDFCLLQRHADCCMPCTTLR